MNKTRQTPFTNRDLYQAFSQRPAPTVPLRLYLTELAKRLAGHSGRSGLSAADFVALILGRPTINPEPGEANSEFAALQAQLQTQIEDLCWFETEGKLDSPYRYFGLDVPSGRRWYNFEVADYLEAATEGTFGGWQPGDQGRRLVPGKVAVLDTQGNLTSVEANEIHNPIEVIEFVDWATLSEFIEAGRSYE